MAASAPGRGLGSGPEGGPRGRGSSAGGCRAPPALRGVGSLLRPPRGRARRGRAPGAERSGWAPCRAVPSRALPRRCWACGCGSWRAACCCCCCSAAAARRGAPPPPPSAPTRCPPCGVSEGPGAAGGARRGGEGLLQPASPVSVRAGGDTRIFRLPPPVLSRGAEEAPGPRRALLGAARWSGGSGAVAEHTPGCPRTWPRRSCPAGFLAPGAFQLFSLLPFKQFSAGFWGGGEGNGR